MYIYIIYTHVSWPLYTWNHVISAKPKVLRKPQAHPLPWRQGLTSQKLAVVFGKSRFFGKRHVDLGSKFGTQLVFKYIKHVTFTDGIFVEWVWYVSCIHCLSNICSWILGAHVVRNTKVDDWTSEPGVGIARI